MKNQTLRIAVSQFPVSTDIVSNLKYIEKHIVKASGLHADIIHFPEMSLSGYETSIENFDWILLDKSLEAVKNLAKKYNIYVVLGSHFKNNLSPKPYNSTQLISNKGEIVGGYHKQKLVGTEPDRFSTKKNTFTYELNGVKCGFLICYDSCFPNLFQQYREQGVKLLFLSYYNAKSSKPKNSMDELMKSQFVTRASDNLMHISGSNSSSKYSRMPSSFVQPDGKLFVLKRHVPGILLCDYPGELGWTYDNEKV